MVVVKFGGELLEESSRLATVVASLARLSSRGVPLVVVHGGGKEIDAALKTAGVEKQQVDGLRITDDRTLDIVVSVLAGTINTRFVAALSTAGVRAVGLTGADASCGLVDPAPPHHAVDGRTVDLGRVGIPSAAADVSVVAVLTDHHLVPVVACIGLGRDGRLFNVNADTCAGHLAAGLGATRLVIAGTTAGVLDDSGSTLQTLEPDAIERLIASGTATAGMIAKLRACDHALRHGDGDVIIVDGRDAPALERAVLEPTPAGATQLRLGAASRTSNGVVV
jgi:acetylglutamate kinase